MVKQCCAVLLVFMHLLDAQLIGLNHKIVCAVKVMINHPAYCYKQYKYDCSIT